MRRKDVTLHAFYSICLSKKKKLVMDITKVHLLFFSPTHTSKRVGESIVHGLGMSEVVTTDLTHESVDLPLITSDVLTVVVMPVYGGHIPHLAALRMADLRSNGAPVVAVVVYGNRAYEKALLELSTFLKGKGFRVIAGATFVGEHSYSTANYPIAAGRPNEQDLKEAEELGHQVRNKLRAADSLDALCQVDVTHIARPKQPLLPLLRFIWQFIRARKSIQSMPVVPTTDESLCNHCGSCVRACPNQAIVKGDECHTLAERCIRCCACVKSCPHKARRFDTPFARMLSTCFKRQKENKVIL